MSGVPEVNLVHKKIFTVQNCVMTR